MVKNKIIMFLLIKQEFIVLVPFSRSLPTKCVFLNNELCIIGNTRIDLNLAELNHYTLLISQDKFNESCKGLMTYLRKYVFGVKQKTEILKFLI